MTNAIPHPSEYIKEELATRDWSVSELANRMGFEDCVLNKLSLDLYFEVGPLKTKMQLGQNMADKLSKAFDVSPDLFLNLEKAWLESMDNELLNVQKKAP